MGIADWESALSKLIHKEIGSMIILINERGYSLESYLEKSELILTYNQSIRQRMLDAVRHGA